MLVHAAAASSRGTTHGTHAVVLHAPGEEALRALSAQLAKEGVLHSAFRESDAPYHGQLMAVGIEPLGDRRTVRRFLKGFSLVR